MSIFIFWVAGFTSACCYSCLDKEAVLNLFWTEFVLFMWLWMGIGELYCIIHCSKTSCALKQSYWYILKYIFSYGRFRESQSIKQFCLVGTSAGTAGEVKEEFPRERMNPVIE